MVNRPGASNRFAVAESSELSISMSVMDRHERHPQEFEPLAELIEIAKRRAILIERMRTCLANGSPSELREIAEAVCGLRSE
jgi:hypothetical protein